MSEITKSYEPREVEKKWYAAWLAAGAFAGRAVPGRERLLHRHSAAQRDRRAHDGPRAQQHPPGHPHPPRPPGGPGRPLDPGHRPRRHRHADRRRARAAQAEEDPPRSRPREVRRAGLGLAQREGRHHPRAAPPARRLLRLGAAPHFTMDPAYSRAVLTGLRGAVPARPHLPRQAHGQLVPRLADRPVRRGGDHEAGQGHALQGALRARRRARGSSSRSRPRARRPSRATSPSRCIPDDPRYAGLVGPHGLAPAQPRAQIPDRGRRRRGPGIRHRARSRSRPPTTRPTIEIGLRHGLPVRRRPQRRRRRSTSWPGPELAGLERFAARKRAAELLRAAGALVGEEAYQNNVGYSERADVPIEPRLTWQWWLRYPARRGGQGGRRATGTSGSIPSAGPRSTCTGSRTSRTGASAGSSGGATGFPSGTARGSTGTA